MPQDEHGSVLSSSRLCKPDYQIESDSSARRAAQNYAAYHLSLFENGSYRYWMIFRGARGVERGHEASIEQGGTPL